MADIFLSYASEDRDRVRSLVEALEKQGWSVWWDREIHAGPRFDRVIQEAIDAASCLVVVWSVQSVESDWVWTEANEGLARSILVPVLLDQVRPPLAFRRAQSANLVGWPQSEGEIATLLAGIRDLIGDAGNAGEPVVDTGVKLPSIAVLPFTNMSSDPEQDYFSDGIASELINGLVNLGQFRVIARTSSSKFAGKDVLDIRQALDVTHVLEGSLQKAAQRLRVTVQLIDTSDETYVWSERYECQLSEVFEVQDQITEAVVRALKGELVPDRPRTHTTEIPEAYEAYLNGRYHLAQSGTDRAYRAAILQLNRAIALDSEFADAHAALALAHFGLRFWDVSVEMELINQCVSRTLELNPHQREALTVQASLFLFQNHDPERAIDALIDIVLKHPHDENALHRLYLAKWSIGIDDTELLNRMIETDPMFENSYRYRASMHTFYGRYDDARRDAQRALELEPNDAYALTTVARCAFHSQDKRTLRDVQERIKTLVGNRSSIYALATRDRDLARAILDDPDSSAQSMNMVVLAIWLGDIDLAMRLYAANAEGGDFMAIVNSRFCVGALDPPDNEKVLRALSRRDDYQSILRSLGIDDESIRPLQQRLGGQVLGR